MAEKILFELVLDTTKLNATAKASAKALDRLVQEQTKLRKAGKQNTQGFQELTNEITRNRKVLRDSTKAIQEISRVREADSGSLQDLKAQLRVVTQARNSMSEADREGTERGRDLTKTSKELTDKLKEQEGAVGQTGRNVGNYAEAIKKGEVKVDGLKDQIKLATVELGKQRTAFNRNTKGNKKFADSVRNSEQRVDGLKDELKRANTELRKQKKALSNNTSTLDKFKDKLKGLQGIIAGAFAFLAIIRAAKAVFDFQQNIADTRKEVNLLTGATGDGLDTITAKVQATADTFEKDFTEVLVTANSLSKQLGITLPEALDLINQGFATGADINGELLNILKEYPAQFKAVGLSASEAIALIQQQTTEGIFSDKGIDSIKEAGLKLRELTPATRDALKAIGLSADEIEVRLADGSASLFDIIQEVSKSLAKLPPQSAVVGTAIADIFGGAGEDAGLEYIKLLGDINLDLDSIVKTGGEFTNTQLKLIAVNERLGIVFNQVLGQADGGFDKLKVTVGTLAADTLEFLVSQFIRVRNFFIRLNNESIVFRAALNLIGVLVKINFGVLFEALKQSIQGFSLLGKAAAAVFRGDFEDVAGILKTGFLAQIDEVKQFGIDAANQFADAYEATVNPKLIDPIVSAQSDIKAASAANGTAAGKAFNKALSEEQKKAIALELKKAKELAEKLKKLKELQQDAEVALIQDKEARLEAIEVLRFERLKASLIKEFGETEKTKILIEQLEIAHHQNLAKIADDAAKVNLDRDLKEIQRKKDQAAEDEKKAKDESDQKTANNQLAKETALNIAQEVSDALFANANENRAREFAADLTVVNQKADTAKLVLDNQLASGLLSQEEFNTKSKLLDDKRAIQETQLRREAFNEQKKADELQALVNGALAIVKAIALFGPPPSPAGIAAIAAAVATTAIQIGVIKSKKFKKGGISSQHIVEGKDHSQGGTTYVGEDGHSFTAERGELITVVNKKSTATIGRLSKLNQKNGNGIAFGRGGVPKRTFGNLSFQDGGFANRQVNQANDQTEILAEALADKIADITIVTDIEDIVDAALRRDRIRNRIRI